MKRLSHKYHKFVMPFILSFMMTAIVSAISVIRTQGVQVDFLAVWLSAWGMSLSIAYPIVLLIMPIVRRVTFCFVRETEDASH